MTRILIPVMLIAALTIAGVSVTYASTSGLKTETVDGFTFNYPSNWDLKERENRFTSVDVGLEYEKGSRTAAIQFEHEDSFSGMDLDTFETLLNTMYDDGSIFESGADKYTINNQSAPYAIIRTTTTNVFGVEHELAVMAIAINLGNDDFVVAQYITTENDFDKLLGDAEEIFQSVKPARVSSAL